MLAIWCDYINMLVNRIYFVVLLYFTGIRCKQIDSPKDAVEYLMQFGYLPSETDVTSVRLPGETQKFKNGTIFTDRISMFQMHAGLKPTGIFDERTKKMMNMPRCGMSERMGIMENKNINIRMLSHKIPKRGRGRWKVSTIFYKIENFPTSLGIDPAVVRQEIQRAFRLWEEVANIRCKEITHEDTRDAEIDIRFASRDHGDGSAFGIEARGNVVAHAFFPDHRRFEGDVHFDDERPWSAFRVGGINLFQVAAHEIGHALGLEHSRFHKSVMFMIVQSEFNQDFRLHDDDIQGIRKLYGKSRYVQPKKGTFPRKLSPDTTALSDVNMVTRIGAGGDTSPNAQPTGGGLNINVILGVPMVGSDISQVEPVVRRLWQCFTNITYDQLDNGKKNNVSKDMVYNCFKQNVLQLYSLKIA